MIRVAEAVLDGHPDKFCDILADTFIEEGYKADPECYGQIEAGVWSDVVWLSGAIVTRQPLAKTPEVVVREVGQSIGYSNCNHIDARKYRISNEACFQLGDPTLLTGVVQDQSIVIGWAGYDERTNYLAPEQYLAHELRESLISAFKQGPLIGEGPDGKLLLRIREEGNRWILEHVLVTIQHREETSFIDLGAAISSVVHDAYTRLQALDGRWYAAWADVHLLVNPNGPLVDAGSDGDNGQTGRKLVMDYYGPRVPIGGGALSGKDLSHIDRLGAYAARHAAVAAVATGARACQVTLVYGPNISQPLEVIYELDGRGATMRRNEFAYEELKDRFSTAIVTAELGRGIHFFDLSLPWNMPSAQSGVSKLSGPALPGVRGSRQELHASK